MGGKWLRRAVYVLAGVLLYAFGVSVLLDPNDLAPGGLIGISVILNRLMGISTGSLYMILNIPVVLLGISKLGYKFMTSTAVVIVLNSFFTDVFARITPITTDPLLAALLGGALVGVGIGIIFRAGTTTGGMDVIIKIIKKKYKFLKTGFLFLVFDMTIVAVSGFVFGNFNTAMYAFIAVFTMGRVMNTVLYASDEARLVFIVSDKYRKAAERIMEELDIGITYLDGEGAYTGRDKKIIMCVLRKQLAPKLEDIIKDEDSNAFMIVSSASEIYGEGYKNILGVRL